MTVTSFGRAAAVLLFSLLAASAAHAVYRCGNVYQDRPCDDKGPQTHLTPGVKAAPSPAASPAPATGGSPAQPAGASPFAPACARVGDEAQKIAWKREGGATQEKQVAELANNGNRAETAALIDSVYRKRGSAPEIRAAVEAECIAQKQQAADTAAALAALRAQQGASAPAPAMPDAAARPAASAQKTAQPAASSASCPSLKASLDSVNADLRRGGNANNMEQLHHRRRSYEQAIREGRC